MSQSDGLPRPERDQERYALRVVRIEAGQHMDLCTVSATYDGMFTHWVKGRSAYCPGQDCPAPNHRLERFWKGYALVVQYVEQRNLWFPVILEITEHLELDFRGFWKRGQYWQVRRAAQTGKHKTPVVGSLAAGEVAFRLPPSIDILPVLRNLYHVHDLVLGQSNPMPARIMVEPAIGAAPPHKRHELGEPLPSQQWLQFSERMKVKLQPQEPGMQQNGVSAAKPPK